MPDPRPDYLPGSFYHIYNRGRSRLSLFLEPDNYLFVLRKLKKYTQELDLALIAYCLLPNHYHFLVRQDGEHPAGLLSQRVFNSYSKAYNKRYNHSGTLFEGPYKIKPVQEPTYQLELCRYIHNNPVLHGLAGNPGDWPYSNYLEWTGERSGTLFVADFVHAHFPTAREYRRFVRAGLQGRELPPEVQQFIDQLDH